MTDHVNVKICHINLARTFRGGERQTEYSILQSCKNYQSEKVVVVCRKGGELGRRLRGVAHLSVVEIDHQLAGHFSSLLSDVTVCHAHEARAVHWAWLHSLMLRTPYIITRRVQNRVKNNWFVRSCYNRARKVVAISSFIRGQLLSDIKVDSVVIPSVSDVFENDESEQFSFDRGRDPSKSILMACALDVQQKGHLVALKALAMMEEEWTITFFGDGPDKGLITNYINSLGLNHRVQFCSWSDGLFVDCCKQHAFYLLPSLHEGLGSILIDVMRLERPIIASRVGGIPDLIKDDETGLLVEPNSARDIVSAILSLYSDPSKTARIVASARQYVARHTPEAMFANYRQYYEEGTTECS